MSVFSKLGAFLKKGINRKKREDEWGARFTNNPADLDGKIPLDPGRSELR